LTALRFWPGQPHRINAAIYHLAPDGMMERKFLEEEFGE
jgi:hypothetical protein